MLKQQGGKTRAEYGIKLPKELSVKLTKEFGSGFTETNLKYFRQFYLSFPSVEISHASSDKSTKNISTRKSHALRGELSWTHYRSLLKVENTSARDFYATEKIAQNWSTRALEKNGDAFICQLRMIFT